jgi:hypothetical protein
MQGIVTPAAYGIQPLKAYEGLVNPLSVQYWFDHGQVVPASTWQLTTLNEAAGTGGGVATLAPTAGVCGAIRISPNTGGTPSGHRVASPNNLVVLQADKWTTIAARVKFATGGAYALGLLTATASGTATITTNLPAASVFGAALYVQTDDKADLIWRHGGDATGSNADVTPALAAATWHVLALRMTQTVIEGWVNGVKVTQTQLTAAQAITTALAPTLVEASVTAAKTLDYDWVAISSEV